MCFAPLLLLSNGFRFNWLKSFSSTPPHTVSIPPIIPTKNHPTAYYEKSLVAPALATRLVSLSRLLSPTPLLCNLTQSYNLSYKVSPLTLEVMRADPLQVSLHVSFSYCLIILATPPNQVGVSWPDPWSVWHWFYYNISWPCPWPMWH